MRREDLEKIARAPAVFGVQYRHAAGAGMLVLAKEPSGRKAIHLVFSGEKVRPEYPEATPELGTYRRLKGLRVIPLEDLVRMKLTSFRASDEAHLRDLDEAGLITPELEAGLSPTLAGRMAQVRARRWRYHLPAVALPAPCYSKNVTQVGG